MNRVAVLKLNAIPPYHRNYFVTRQSQLHNDCQRMGSIHTEPLRISSWAPALKVHHLPYPSLSHCTHNHVSPAFNRTECKWIMYGSVVVNIITWARATNNSSSTLPAYGTVTLRGRVNNCRSSLGGVINQVDKKTVGKDVDVALNVHYWLELTSPHQGEIIWNVTHKKSNSSPSLLY